jgi:hypothetical protein
MDHGAEAFRCRIGAGPYAMFSGESHFASSAVWCKFTWLALIDPGKLRNPLMYRLMNRVGLPSATASGIMTQVAKVKLQGARQGECCKTRPRHVKLITLQ